MGERGIRALLPVLGPIDMALVGEPTGMQAAAGERGLVVLDCTARGRSGHAARNEGINALYIALDDIARLRTFRFERESALLGPVGIAVTQIEAGYAAQRRARRLPLRRRHPHDGRLHERGDGRNPPPRDPFGSRAPLDAHPRRGRRGRPSAHARRPRRRTPDIRLAHDFGHGR